MDSFKIHFHWGTAVDDTGKAYEYPAKFSRSFRERYSVPAIYCWRVLRIEPNEHETIYIGEAEDLVTRIQRVRTPAKKSKRGDTNKRLKQIFDGKLSVGRTIVLDILDFESFEVNGVRFLPNELGDRFKRRALENLLLCIAQDSGCQLMNKVVDPVEKTKKILSRLSPRQLGQVLKEIELKKKRPGVEKHT